MHLRRFMTGVAALGLSALMAGCASDATVAATSAVPTQAGAVTAAASQETDIPQTLTYVGIVSNVDAGGMIVMQTTQNGDLACNTSADTIFVNAVTGREASLSDVRVGTYVSATVTPAMTRSVPPQAACYAMILDIPQNGLGSASYVQVSSVNREAEGALQIMNQNDDTVISIPADIPVERLGSDETVEKADIVEGSKLIVWYDAVTLSVPAKATALRVVYCS